MKGLKGKNVIVTGAASGIGRATAKRFVDEGAKVAMFDLKAEAIQATADELGLPEGSYLVVPMDVTNDEQVKASIDKVKDTFGSVDVVCNIAGIVGKTGSIVDIDVAEARKVIEVNLLGTYDMIHHALPIMQAQENGGVIINTASVDGTASYTYEAPYAVSKAAVIHLTQNAANENGDKVRINCVSPGWVMTPMMEAQTNGLEGEDLSEDELVDYGPLGRAQKPEEIAGVFAMLASDDAYILNGVDIHADGGKFLGKK